MSKAWEVHWVEPGGATYSSVDPLLESWGDLDEREASWNIDPGDPFLTDPEYRVDARLTSFFTRSSFAHLAVETKRNYANDCCLFFNFLWQRGKQWWQATADDLLDFEDWRRWSPRNPKRIGGSKWNRELAALARLYKWAVRAGHVAVSPVNEREATDRYGERVRVPAAYAKDVRSSNVRWLTPRAYRLWRDVGLRGYSADGRRDGSWRGRNDDRNAAYSDLLFSSGMRRTEGGSLLTIEVPALDDSGRLYFDGRLGWAATKSKRERTFYVSAQALRAIDAYCRTSRRAAIRRAQAEGRYESGRRWVVTGRSGWRRSIVHVKDERGRTVERALGTFDPAERLLLFTEGDGGLEPLWLWLAEDGTPFRPHSWEAVYRAASVRCQALLEGQVKEPPYFTPHMARHSFALYMLVALLHAADRRFGLTAEERRDFHHLYGDVWRMVKDLLGHASAETTEQIYLAPVSDLQVRSLLLEEQGGEITDLLAMIAQRSERVLDVEEES